MTTTSTSMTSRERVADIAEALQAHEVTPEEARNYLMALTGLLGALTQEFRLADRAFKRVLFQCQQVEKVAARARVAAEATTEYDEMCACKDASGWCEEAIMSCKAFLRSLDNEMNLAR